MNRPSFYKAQGLYDKAELLYIRAIVIMKKTLPLGHSKLEITKSEYDHLKNCVQIKRIFDGLIHDYSTPTIE